MKDVSYKVFCGLCKEQLILFQSVVREKVLVTGAVLPVQRHRGINLHGISWELQNHTGAQKVGVRDSGDRKSYK